MTILGSRWVCIVLDEFHVRKYRCVLILDDRKTRILWMPACLLFFERDNSRVFLKRCRNSQRLCQSDSMSTVSRTVRFNAAKYLQTFISLIACLYVWGFFCLWTNTPVISACEVTVRCTAWFIQHCRSQRTVPLPFTKRCVTNVGTRHCHSQNKSEPRKHNFRRFLRV